MIQTIWAGWRRLCSSWKIDKQIFFIIAIYHYSLEPFLLKQYYSNWGITMGKIVLKHIAVQGSKITYEFNVSNELQIYFNDHPFSVEYEEDMTDVPYAILAIPFLTNVLPIAWITDSEIMVESVDKSFYESIPLFKKGYEDMYPQVSFKGKLTAETVDDCCYPHSGRTAVFFSSGVDSYCTLIRNISRKPDLITIWGSDITLDNTDGWRKVKEATIEAAETFGLEKVFIKSSFRLFINYKALDELSRNISTRGWWGGIHHGIGIIGHAAPYAWKHHISIQYIAASYCDKDTNVQCASYPTIDGNVKFGSCIVSHDSFDYNRQAKINEIIRFHDSTGLPMRLRVCWESSGGGNCCSCEKCSRTIMGILVTGKNPKDYNFDMVLNKETLAVMRNLVVWSDCKKISLGPLWAPIQAEAIKNKNQLKKLWYYKYIKWIYAINFSDIEHNPIRRRYESITGVKVFLSRFIPKPLYKILKRQ